jgi:hypothetical protein
MSMSASAPEPTLLPPTWEGPLPRLAPAALAGPRAMREAVEVACRDWCDRHDRAPALLDRRVPREYQSAVWGLLEETRRAGIRALLEQAAPARIRTPSTEGLLDWIALQRDLCQMAGGATPRNAVYLGGWLVSDDADVVRLAIPLLWDRPGDEGWLEQLGGLDVRPAAAGQRMRDGLYAGGAEAVAWLWDALRQLAENERRPCPGEPVLHVVPSCQEVRAALDSAWNWLTEAPQAPAAPPVILALGRYEYRLDGEAEAITLSAGADAVLQAYLSWPPRWKAAEVLDTAELVRRSGQTPKQIGALMARLSRGPLGAAIRRPGHAGKGQGYHVRIRRAEPA